MFSLSPSLLSFSSFPPSSSLFVRKRVNTPTLLVSLMAPWKPVTPFFTDLRVCASVCVCVYVYGWDQGLVQFQKAKERS